MRKLSKIVKVFIAAQLSLVMPSFAKGAAKPQTGSETSTSWDSSKSNPCNFGCKEIPADSKVLIHLKDATQEVLDDVHFRVVAWNLYKGRMKNFKPDFFKIMEGADVILTSEATNDEKVEPAFFAMQGYGWDFATSFLMKKNVATGVAIGSKARALDVRFSRTDDLEPLVNSPKAIIMATFAIPGTTKRLLTVSIHGINFNSDEALGRQLEKVLPSLQAHQGPIVFAGDFNTKNSARVQIAKKVLARAGLVRVNWENPRLTKQLDDAFVRDLKVNSARLIEEYVNDGSDHPALDLDLSYVE